MYMYMANHLFSVIRLSCARVCVNVGVYIYVYVGARLHVYVHVNAWVCASKMSFIETPPVIRFSAWSIKH